MRSVRICKVFPSKRKQKNFHVVRIFTGGEGGTLEGRHSEDRWKGGKGGGIRKFKLLFYSCISILTHEQGE